MGLILAHEMNDFVIEFLLKRGVIQDAEDSRVAILHAIEEYWTDKVAIVWEPVEVARCIAELSNSELTAEQIPHKPWFMEVLERAIDEHDANDGITNDVIKDFIQLEFWDEFQALLKECNCSPPPYAVIGIRDDDVPAFMKDIIEGINPL